MTFLEFDHTTSPATASEIHHELQPLESISLTEMDSVALMNRVDTKYVLGEDCLLDLLRRIQTDYRILEIDGIRIFQYETLYFDTPQRQCYLQHHNGKLNRQKYRIRKYQSSGPCFLEVKKKTSKGRTDKSRITVPQINGTLSSHQETFIREATGSLPDLRPEIWTCFSRLTLVNRSLPERVTVDRELSFHNEKNRRQLPGLVIAEVKQERDNRSTSVREHLRDLEVRPMRVSKYCLGSVLLTPGLKYNRFKAKLMAIKKVV